MSLRIRPAPTIFGIQSTRTVTLAPTAAFEERAKPFSLQLWADLRRAKLVAGVGCFGFGAWIFAPVVPKRPAARSDP